MSAPERWRRMLAGEPADQLLVDVGTSTVTGVRAPGAPTLAGPHTPVGHRVLQTVALGGADTVALGSDFVRCGVVHDRPVIGADDTTVDELGIEWLWADGAPAPLNHPLQDAEFTRVAGHPRPLPATRLQLPDLADAPAGRPLVVADAPMSGLLETCFGLRNSWQFMLDVTDNWRVANALLDWATETVATAYEQLLAALPVVPDVVIYGDDYGHQGGMFLSDEDFRTFVRPRLRTLFSRIRRATPAAICFHCCGAVGPILADLADLGVEALNLEYDAKGMELHRVRERLPRSMILHGYTDLLALGRAVVEHDEKSIAVLTDELVASTPVVAAPVDSLATETELLTTAVGARFVRALDPDDVARLRRLGPVRDVLTRAADTARDTSTLVASHLGRPPHLMHVTPCDAPSPGVADPQAAR